MTDDDKEGEEVEEEWCFGVVEDVIPPFVDAGVETKCLLL